MVRLRTLLRWVARLAAAAFGIALLGVAGHLFWADGPSGPLAGGPFRTGTESSPPSDLATVLTGSFEFELVSSGRSRTAGGIAHDGELYITCDLGFIWNRLPAGAPRTMLHAIWLFKDWHERAQEDGRVRIRRDGQIYSATITLVEEADTIDHLKTALENEASAFFAPDPLGPRPERPPNEILFFRVSAI